MADQRITMSDLRDQLESTRSRFARYREAGEERASRVQNTALRVVAAYGLASVTRGRRTRGEPEISIFGLSTEQTVSLGLMLAGEMSGGRLGEALRAAGEGALCATAVRMADASGTR